MIWRIFGLVLLFCCTIFSLATVWGRLLLMQYLADPFWQDGIDATAGIFYLLAIVGAISGLAFAVCGRPADWN